MNSGDNEEKLVIAKKLIRTLKIKIYKYMTATSKSSWYSKWNKLADIVNEYNYTYYSTMKMKPFNINSTTYIDFGIESNDKDSKFKVSIMWGYHNMKMFSQKVSLQISFWH